MEHRGSEYQQDPKLAAASAWARVLIALAWTAVGFRYPLDRPLWLRFGPAAIAWLVVAAFWGIYIARKRRKPVPFLDAPNAGHVWGIIAGCLGVLLACLFTYAGFMIGASPRVGFWFLLVPLSFWFLIAWYWWSILTNMKHPQQQADAEEVGSREDGA